MNLSAKSIAKFMLFLGIGILLIWLVVKDISSEDKTNIIIALKSADYKWILLALFLGLVSHISRAVRWNMLLFPLNHKPKLQNTFFAVMVGYLANLALPRMGEVSRCGVLTKYEKIPFNESFGTVVTERVIDTLTMLAIFFLTLFIEADIIYDLAKQKILSPFYHKIQHLSANRVFLVSLFLITTVGIIALLMLRKKIKGFVFEKIKNILLGFWSGIKSIRYLKSPWLFLFHSLFIWFLYYVQIHICFLAFPESSKLGIEAGLAVLIFGTLGIVFIPGGTGAYQTLVIETLCVFAVSFAVSFALAWVLWSMQIILVVVVGVGSLILLPIVNKNEKI